MLTTITPYWGRPDMLKGWLDALQLASVPEVRHIIFFVGEDPPAWFNASKAPVLAVRCAEPPGQSIGHYHNEGARLAQTEWIMKLDVDTVPNVRYFRHLLPVLQSAGEREWFNGGMIYLSRSASNRLTIPVTESSYSSIMAVPRAYAAENGHEPAGSNFICRREDYLKLGGCLDAFRGYGWEDYQQLYMLERHQLGKEPLPGGVTMDNVTARCRDEIGRRKAKELRNRDRWLVLLHRWHATAPNKTSESMGRNRAILFDYVERQRMGS
jgi:hypothetical protein